MNAWQDFKYRAEIKTERQMRREYRLFQIKEVAIGVVVLAAMLTACFVLTWAAGTPLF